MRNLGTRFNESNIIEVDGKEGTSELENSLHILRMALDCNPTMLTPSEERVIEGFKKWYSQVNGSSIRPTQHPAYAYVNLNTGVNLLFLVRIPYEGCLGGRPALLLDPEMYPESSLKNEDFD